MRVRRLGIEGAWEMIPEQHRDDRGRFLEWYRHEYLTGHVGHPLTLAQASMSVSRRGVVRGIHFADVPPGQAKYVTCVRGAVLDVVVDLRRGSPGFGRWEALRLDDVHRNAVYLSEGLGHGICALTDEATLCYLCSHSYNPVGERGVHALDPELGIRWPVREPQLSPRDRAAPSLAEAGTRGLLPDYDTCLAFTDSLRVE